MDKIKSFFNSIKELWESIYELFSFPLIPFGDSPVSVGEIILFIFSIILLFYLSGKAKNILIHRILKRYKHEIGTVQSIGTIFRYTIIVIGLLIIVQNSGIDLSAFGIIAGAFSVGIGFGLQNITNNFISGIIILFERPIKVGDRIEVGNVRGDVVTISARSTTVITNDNISIIVPNSEFISSTVINWSHNDRNVRFWFPVGVSYNEDPEKVEKILLEIADEIEGILPEPNPQVIFEEFGDSSMNFSLVAWSNVFTNRPKVLRSEVNFAIAKKFQENNIEIPFPQRDVHIKSQDDKKSTINGK